MYPAYIKKKMLSKVVHPEPYTSLMVARIVLFIINKMSMMPMNCLRLLMTIFLKSFRKDIGG